MTAKHPAVVVGYRDRPIGAFPRALAEQRPDGVALAFPTRRLRLTFAQMEVRVDALARGLRAAGLKPGDRVAILAGNIPDWPVAMLAVARAGGVTVPVNTRLAAPEMEYILDHSGASILLIAAGLPAPASAPLHLRTVILMDADKGRCPTIEETLLAGGDSGPNVGLDELALILYTSGTTGTPKGVMLSHRNVVNNAHALARGLGFGPSDRLCTTFPFFHIAGCVMSVLGCLSHGACLVGVDEPGPRPVLRAIEAERCTALFGVATVFTDMLADPELESFDLSSLRTGTMGGAVCPEPLLRQLVEKLNLAEMTVSYGLTETSPIITLTGRHDLSNGHTQTVGRGLPEVEVRIVDPATRQPLPALTPGELATRSPYVMMGYYRQPEATDRAVDREGWLYTGDQATMDESGCVRITGRLKDLIIRGGENISPASVEDVLRQHPAVLDACVYGLPDVRLGERVAAAIRLRAGHAAPDLEQIAGFCRGKLANFKVPSELRVMESFPLTASGKVKRYELREHELEGSGAVGS